MQAGEKAWEAFLQALKAIKPDLGSDEVFDFVNHKLPFTPGVPRSMVSIVKETARGASVL